MDEHVKKAIQPDGALFDLGWYLSFSPGSDEATLDGEFTAQQLRDIADHMDRENAKRKA